MTLDPGDSGPSRSLSYAELDSRARALGARLASWLAPGDRVLLSYPEGLEFPVAFFACLYAGVVAVPAPPPGNANQRRRMNRIADDCGMAAVLTGGSEAEHVRAWARERGGAEPLVVDTTRPAPAAPPPARVVGHDTTALLQYTSGTTREPRGVVLSHGNVLHNMAAIVEAAGVDENTRFGSWLPLYHDMGLAILFSSVILGATTVQMSPMSFLRRPASWLELIDRHRINVSSAPDFGYRMCVSKTTDTQLAGLDLTSWQFALVGAEPVDAGTVERFAHRFRPVGFSPGAFCPVYGLAESTVYVSGLRERPPWVWRAERGGLEQDKLLPAEDGEGVALVSCGPVLHHDIRVVDSETGSTLDEDHVGEIWLRGESIGEGYWRGPTTPVEEFTATTYEGEGGFLRTGDLGVLHRGELFVTGRIADRLNLPGRHLSAHELERLVRRDHSDRLPSVVVFTDPRTDASVVVAAELRGRGEPADLRTLAARIRGSVSDTFSVSVSDVVLLRRGDVLLTTSGKPRRLRMRERYARGALAVVASLDDR